jgi:hypothetical protein
MVEVEEIEKRRREEGSHGGGEGGASLGSASGSPTDWRTICDRGGWVDPYGADAILTPASARILYGL